MARAGPPMAAVFGAAGFVGSHLVRHLAARGFLVREIMRGDQSWRGADLGHVFYTIGLTADFRSKPFETVEAHVSLAAEVLKSARFESFVYCSSTRVYATADTTREGGLIPASSTNPDHLYNISKLMGEAITLSSGHRNARVARLSNVFGRDLQSANFLTAVIREAVEQGRISLKTDLQSAKDYVSVDDVVRGLEAIAVRGREPITNVAFGRNTTHDEIVRAVAAVTGASITIADGAPIVRFPEIETRALDGLGVSDRVCVTDAIADIVAAFQRASRGPTH